MRKRVIVVIACLAVIGAVFADEHPKEHPGAKPAMAAGAGALDGKVFVGELSKSGETKGDKDQLTFKGATFVSSACIPYGFHETAYTTTEKDGVVTFMSKATNAAGETMSWTGTIKDGVLEGTAVNKSTSGETTYTFKGKLGAAQAGSKEHPKKSEHPSEHPKK